jgi:hypothetical protein
VNGTQFVLNNSQFKFVGANIYNAAGSDFFSCGTSYSDQELNDTFHYLRTQAGVSVIRFWAFETYTNNGTDWSGIDRVISLAKQNDLKLIPVLENQWEECTRAGYKYNWWYNGAYKTGYDYPVAYRDYVRMMVSRYKDEPTIMAWMLMNEAENRDDTTQGSMIYNFTADMSGLIKSIDSHHLVTLGTIGTGQPGIDGNKFNRLYGISTVDFVEGHDYHAETQALPGSDAHGNLPDYHTCYNSLACDLAVSQSLLHKPFIIGESGIEAGSGFPYTLDQRASLFNNKLSGFFSKGTSGFIIWQWDRIDDQGYAFSYDDPLVTVLHNTPL